MWAIKCTGSINCWESVEHTTVCDLGRVFHGWHSFHLELLRILNMLVAFWVFLLVFLGFPSHIFYCGCLATFSWYIWNQKKTRIHEQSHSLEPEPGSEYHVVARLEDIWIFNVTLWLCLSTIERANDKCIYIVLVSYFSKCKHEGATFFTQIKQAPLQLRSSLRNYYQQIHISVFVRTKSTGRWE